MKRSTRDEIEVSAVWMYTACKEDANRDGFKFELSKKPEDRSAPFKVWFNTSDGGRFGYGFSSMSEASTFFDGRRSCKYTPLVEDVEKDD